MDAYNYPYIRDTVVINAYVQNFYNTFVGDGPVYLFGRVVTHEADLLVGQRPLVIIADEYHGNGYMIDARGAYPGGNGGTVIVRCKRSTGAHVSVSGGQGFGGTTGADGTEGTPDIVIEGEWVTVPDPWPMETSHEEWRPGETIPGTPGSPPGIGGSGGPGGNAGALIFTSTTEDGYPTLEAEGGSGGPGGPGGFLGNEQAPYGEGGASGASSAINYTVVSDGDFLALVRGDIGIYANYWAPFRIVVADYYYHKYNARVADRANCLTLAAGELAAALQFQPDNAGALRLQKQMLGFPDPVAGTDRVVWKGGGNNALGLPRQMDLLPRFDYYIDAYANFGALAVGFLTNGTQWLSAAEGISAMGEFANQQLTQVIAARDNSSDELDIAKTELKYAAEEVTYAKQRLDKVITEIQTALPVMATKSFSFAGLFGTVASIGAAVVSIVAAIPTAGASVVALAPSLVALSNSLSDNAEPIAKALIEDAKVKNAELEQVKKAYEKVGKNVDEVVKGGKSIVSFVKLVQGLNATTTSDNSKYVALVKQGAELAHDLMLAGNRATLAQQRVDAAAAKLARAEAVVTSVDNLKKALDLRQHTLRQVGLAAMDIAASKANLLQTLAFRAQRSVEIYTLEDQEQNVFLDAGMISPDDGRAFYEGEKDEAALASALLTSWGRILNPLSMKLNYISFFDARPDWDTYRLSFTDLLELASFRNTNSFSFRIEATDLHESHFETKVKNVLVSLVGARNQSAEISCMVRHGGQYEQRRLDGKVEVQLLAPQTINRRAKTTRLDRPVANTDAPLDAPTSLAIWGRGVGGDWELRIEQHEIESGSLDLSGLSEIQIWVDYQFTR
ncbi:hypothetical protein NKG99_07085 [Mesorhizobium sp. M1409]|uniref:hypothetical protein n=1 Tax=unclassified Mesorhizobium TaxID=325217 RepID=UPI00333C616D